MWEHWIFRVKSGNTGILPWFTFNENGQNYLLLQFRCFLSQSMGTQALLLVRAVRNPRVSLGCCVFPPTS